MGQELQEGPSHDLETCDGWQELGERSADVKNAEGREDPPIVWRTRSLGLTLMYNVVYYQKKVNILGFIHVARAVQNVCYL